MAIQPPPKAPPPLDTIEFEATDFDSARQALDELPPGVVEVQQLQPGFWEQRRRKPTATDRALTGAAMDWVIGLPPSLRPPSMPRRLVDVLLAHPDPSTAAIASPASMPASLVQEPENIGE